MMQLKAKFFYLLKRMHLVPNNLITIKDLDKFRGLEKQLDEYRELLETIEKETGYFSSTQGFYSIGHAEMLDDYLSYLYEIRFGQKPAPSTAINYLRAKPSFIQNSD
ncbi:hypothetical protein M5252_004566 [Vibrio parahaemolyticus]|nr:hypothetical protein [Vibrio parahaemolyticus]EJE8775013.1 hypothetical protein [Vibrio parahaemolyticus]